MNKQSLVIVVLIVLASNYAAYQFGISRASVKTAGLTQSPSAPSKDRTPHPHPSPVQGKFGVNQVLMFEPTTLAFGSVPPAEKPARTVKFHNPTGETVRVKKVNASCGCTVPKVEPMEIAPGESGELTVTFDPTLIEGAFTKTVSIEYEGLSEIDTLSVTGEVSSKIMVSPRSVKFSGGEKFEFTVVSKGPGAFNVTNFGAPAGLVPGSPEPLEGQNGYKFTVTVQHDVPQSSLLRVLLDDDEVKELSVFFLKNR